MSSPVTRSERHRAALGPLLLHDLFGAARGLRRSRTFTIVSVATLGLAIGMATAMFAVYHGVLLRQLPVPAEQNLVLPRALEQGGAELPIWPIELERVRRDSRTLADAAGVGFSGAMIYPLVQDDLAHVLRLARVTGNFFELLGVQPVLGRLLVPSDDLSGADPVLVLSHEAWRSRFGADASMVGRRLLDPFLQARYTVIGVAPPGLEFPAGVEGWVPAAPFGQALLTLVARRAPNVPDAAIQAEFLALARDIDAARPAQTHPARAEVTGFRQAVVGDVRPALLVLTAAVALLLMIACVNVGNLLLVRTTARAREIAIRRSLGATPADIMRQILLETVLLTFAGGVVGVVCARLLLALLVEVLPDRLPRAAGIALTPAPVLAAFGVSLLSALLFAALPTLAAMRSRLAAALRFDMRSGAAGPSRRQVRQALVAAQVALALVMLTGAGLLLRSLQRLQNVPLGYNPDGLAILNLSLPVNGAPTAGRQLLTFERIAQALRALPGVTALTPIEIPPFLGTNVVASRFAPEYESALDTRDNSLIPIEVGGPEYFRTLGVPLHRGRGFTDGDDENAANVAIVSESLARLWWPGEDAVGKRFRSVFDTSAASWRTVVGVAGDIRFRSLREVAPTIYLPWRQYPWQGVFAVRFDGHFPTVLRAMRQAVLRTEPSATLWRAETMHELLSANMAQHRLSTILLSGFGIVALILAAVGLYGVMATTVREQTRAIGIRMALGSTPAQQRTEVISQAGRVIATGAIAGAAASMASSGLFRSLVFDVSPIDPVALIGAGLLLLVVGILAAHTPARRATRVEPANVLRME